uniref:Cyclin N-terminal domain-containing protein n=1 Tax=Aegilops tauschii subsp. strangulata TaxID=200361 RepID=A0A453IQ68_AEGTS
MGDASTSAAPATPTSTLICLEDGNDLFLDDDSPAGGLADSRLAADDGLLLLDRDDEYVALMLSKEGAGAGAGACGEELDEWTKAARAVCVDWIVKTNARFLFSGKTAYVAVTYLDRFLAQRRVDVRGRSGPCSSSRWPASRWRPRWRSTGCRGCRSSGRTSTTSTAPPSCAWSSSSSARSSGR